MKSNVSIIALLTMTTPVMAAKLTTPGIQGLIESRCIVSYSGSTSGVSVTATMVQKDTNEGQGQRTFSQTFRMGPNNRVTHFERSCNTNLGQNMCDLTMCFATFSVPSADVALSIGTFNPNDTVIYFMGDSAGN
jgi:hypothetical protein